MDKVDPLELSLTLEPVSFSNKLRSVIICLSLGKLILLIEPFINTTREWGHVTTGAADRLLN